jgi:alkaline phosphatase D
MERRGFLTGLAAGAIGWVAAGRPPATGTAPRVYAHPVRFVSAAEAAETGASFIVNDARTAASQATTYPQSVASGDPNPYGAVLWTRVDPSAMAPGIDTVSWQIADAAGFTAGSIIVQGSVAILSQNDNTVSLPISNTALAPFTVYYYQFIYNGVASRTGRFKTLPLATDTVTQLNVGLTNCQDYSNGFYNAYAYLAQEELDVVVFLGDYIYEYLNDGVGGPDNGPVRVVPPYPSGAQYPTSLADYRHLYQTYRADPNIQAAHEMFAFILLWDDHEFYNDCHQDYHPDTEPAGVTANTPQPALRSAATQAWTEYSMAAVPFNPDLNWENEITVYRSFSFGTLAQPVVTDERLYRDGPPCGSTEDDRYLTVGCGAQQASNRTMLGATQKSWFLDEMTQSKANWKLWANEVMLAQYKYGVFGTPAALFFDLDAWDGYEAERANILTSLHSDGVKNLVALSGDAHLFMASYLKTNFNSLFQAPVAVEFLTGPISSSNYSDSLSGVPFSVPASAPGPVRKLRRSNAEPLDTLAPVVLSSNPHMQYWNGSAWGYSVLTITAKSLVCAFRAVSTVKQDSATLSTLVTYTVPAGKVQLTQS